jgi:hypothetical protein
MSTDFQIQQQKIRQLFVTHDIEGLIALGAPNSEYAIEADAIFSTIRQVPEPNLILDTITSIVLSTWQTSFDLSDDQMRDRLPHLYAVSREIFNIVQK